MEGKFQALSTPFRLYLSGIIASFLFVSTGCVFSWTSPTFPLLRKSGAITTEEETWVGSFISIGAALGPVIVAVYNDRIGRKKTIYLVSSAYFLSWLVLSLSQNFYVICLGRILGGIGNGGSFTTVSIFLAEISDPERRNSIASFNQPFIAVGFLLEYCIGPYVNYITLILISWMMVVLFAGIFYVLPESPYYLIASGRKKEAIDSLCWYRGDLEPYQVGNELQEIEENQSSTSKQEFGKSVKILFTKRGPIRGLLISFYLLVIQQGSAYNAVIMYTQDIFSKTRMKLAPEYCSMIIGATNLIASLPSPFLVRRYGLKSVFIASGVGMGVALGFLSVYFYLIDLNYNVTNLDFLPIISIIFYNVFYCWGLGSLPWAVIAESFPTDIKSIAMAICGSFSFTFSFAIISVFSILLSKVGATIVFFILFLFMTIGSLGVVFVLPDTSGMSLREIQDHLNHKN